MNYETRIGREATTLDYQADPSTARSHRWIWIVAVLAIIAALGAAYFAFKGGPAPTAKQSPTAAGDGDKNKQVPRITVSVPGRQVVANVISATGSLAARHEMPVGVAGEGGLVARVWVDAGDWVRQGQVLVSIDRSVQVQESNQLSAGIAVAQSDARLAQSELDRARALLSRGFISKADIDRRTATRDAAIARVAVAKAQLGAGQARTNRLDVRAPATGYVLSRSVEAGQVVSAGSPPLFRIARGGEMEHLALLSEGDLAKMSVGLPASVTPVGTNTAFQGQIWQISPTIDPSSRQGIARIALNFNPALRPGGFASASIKAGAADAPLLPESAVHSDAQGSYVYIVGADNKVARRDVTIGSINDGGATIKTGLSGQESVVLSAGAFLNPGETVIPVRQVLKR
ncbi:MAG: efflux RND transporter periplasmic adaptor subunit [Sphingomonadaceae bacterium]